jgi:hypothetical protein
MTGMDPLLVFASIYHKSIAALVVPQRANEIIKFSIDYLLKAVQQSYDFKLDASHFVT